MRVRIGARSERSDWTFVSPSPSTARRGTAALSLHDARVVEAPQQPTLEGNRLAQVPEHNATLGVRYTHPAIATVSATARYVGGQFEDDLNTLPLGSYVVLDLFVSRALARWAEVFVGVENLFGQTYSTPKRFSDRKSTRLNSSHTVISYAVFCLKKKKKSKIKYTV